MFLGVHLRAGARIMFYTDETRPGNQLRPDKGREYQAILWSFAELPHWYLNRQHGYLKFAYVPSKTVIELGGMCNILRQMLLMFFGPTGFSFTATGVRIPSAAGLVHIHAKFGFLWLMKKPATEIST